MSSFAFDVSQIHESLGVDDKYAFSALEGIEEGKGSMPKGLDKSLLNVKLKTITNAIYILGGRKEHMYAVRASRFGG